MLRIAVLSATVIVYTSSVAFQNWLARNIVDSFPETGGAVGLFQHVASSRQFYLLVGTYGLTAAIYMISLKFLPISVAGPIFLVLSIVATVLLGMIVFGERVTMWQAAGMALSLAGVITLGLSSSLRGG